jgi:hypothetical protein
MSAGVPGVDQRDPDSLRLSEHSASYSPFTGGSRLRFPGSYSGAMPFSVSSSTARLFFDRCVNPMPRGTFGALVNWTFS